MADGMRLRGLTHVEGDSDLPERTSVAIIGGGIVGAMAALVLAEQGVPVCLFEKGRIAGEQSGRNWGWVRKMGRQAADIRLAIMADGIWPTLDARTGHAMGYRVNGSIYPCDTQAEVEHHRKWRDEIGRPAGVDSRILTSDETMALLPGCVRPFAGALYTASDGCAEPFHAAPGIALGARTQGAKIFTGCAVRGVERSGGRISAVVTERGTVACDAVILATGAWSSLFLRHLGLRLPQLRLRASVAQVEGVGDAPDICCSARDVTFRKRLDGTWTYARRSLNTTDISPDHIRYFFDFLPMLRQNRDIIRLRWSLAGFRAAWRDDRRWKDTDQTVFERIRVLDPPGDPQILSMGRQGLLDAFPAFRDMTAVQDWSGFIEGTPDGMPVLGPAAKIPGLVIATGFSGHGFGIGPAVGQIAAELATGATPSEDIHPFRPGRFRKA
ncbi:NAD(P)/FAD-dependent oxidoreductase [Chachezhania sediminis]|uniref:NAD(P)/FAD-dependent oxidoreductase n=1 Tax=Chachezhania sediminis TaxID=2599291 RepID=UPI00131CEF4C|nr:FAD-binding oxidoreductase [Chachezhania sediminis]